jgi:hypothetical protein
MTTPRRSPRAQACSMMDLQRHRTAEARRKLHEADRTLLERAREREWQRLRQRYQYCPCCGRPT